MRMMLSLSHPLQNHCCYLKDSSFLPCSSCIWQPRINYKTDNKSKKLPLSISCSSPKIVRDTFLDTHVKRNNRIRFVLKLKTLLLSKPKHYIPLHILSKCKSYLSLPDRRSIASMIHRYPSIFELFEIPTPHLPINATKPGSQLCVRLTPTAAKLAAQEKELQTTISDSLATKLQKLLMMSSHHRILLSKLVHLAPDLGLPANFRSRLCNDYPERFKTVDTSYGRALELVSWNHRLAVPFPCPPDVSVDLIVDRPLKFKHLRLRKGLNLKKHHQDFLIKFSESPDVCPYTTSAEEFVKGSVMAEKRSCAVVREVLGMTVEKRTLLDHLTHFRTDFGFSNQLRGMIVRHPELFYVSVKGMRNSVFLTECFDSKGKLLEKDETLGIKERLMELVSESKRIRKEMRNRSDSIKKDESISESDYDIGDEDYDDGFEDLFEFEDLGSDDFDVSNEVIGPGGFAEFWTADASFTEERQSVEPW